MKQQLRKEITDKINALSDEYIKKSNSIIFEKLMANPYFLAAKRVFAYYSINREIDTHIIIDESLRLGKAVALPITLGGGKMFFADIFSDSLISGKLGIPEPINTSPPVIAVPEDVILVPALCYDKYGNRLGYGGGYYDRYLKTCAACKIGLARRALMLDAIPACQYDVPVEKIIMD